MCSRPIAPSGSGWYVVALKVCRDLDQVVRHFFGQHSTSQGGSVLFYPDQSMIPPNNRDSAQFLSGAVPNVLLVLALGPHSQSRSSSTHTTTRGVGNMPSASRPPLSVAGGAGEPKRSASIFSVLSAAVGLSSSEDDEVVVEERTPLLGGENEDEERVEGDEEVEEDDAIGATSSAIASAFTTGGSRRERKRRNSRSRSKSQRRKLHWWERPSPIWFLPGTLLMSLSIGSQFHF